MAKPIEHVKRMVERIFSPREVADPTRKRRAPRGAGLKWIADHVDHASDECLIWPFGRDRDGYGIVWKSGRQSRAHRVMCEEAHGLSEFDGAVAAHSCGNGHMGCVNPSHIRWATHHENHADSRKHGTFRCGEDTVMAKLKKDDVLKIVEMSAGTTHAMLGEIFGVKRATITGILNGWSWKHVTGIGFHDRRGETAP